MNSKKIKEIVKFSIQKNLQNKWFIILNIFIFISIIATTNVNNITIFLENNNINFFNEKVSIEIIDKENLISSKLIEAFELSGNIEIIEVEENTYTKDNIIDKVIIIEVTKSDEHYILTTVTSKEKINNMIYYEIENAVINARNELFAQNFEIDESDLGILSTSPNITSVMLGVDAENSDTKEGIKIISTVALYMISIFIFSKIANEIAQEKVSKSIEYVLTSVTEKEYLLAKIISIISLVLFQGMYFFAYYIIGNLINNIININVIQDSQINNMMELLNGIDRDIVIYILTVFVYSVLTLVLMSIIQAALSSKTTNMSEAGNTITFLMTITITMYMLTLFLIKPYTNMTMVMYIISCIPLASNYFIPAIIIIGQATPLQIIVSLLLLVISIPIAFNKCSVIFKNGVLDYKPNAKTKKSKKERSLKEEQEHNLTVSKFRKYAFVLGIAIILWMTFQVLGQFLIGVLVAPFLSNILNLEQIELLILITISIISMIIPIGFLSLYTDKKEKKEIKLSLKNKFNIVFIGIFLIGIIQIIIAFVYEKIGINYNIIEVLNADLSNQSILTKLLFVTAIAIVPAIFEELLFRKAIINYSKKIGPIFAIIISSIIFGLIHMNMSQAIFAFLLGIVFAIIYIKTENIWYSILLHFVNNFYAVLMQIFISNQISTKPVSVLVLISMTIGLILTIEQIYINREKIKNIKNIKIDKSKISLGYYKYVFTDFTIIVAIILVITCFSLTENILTGM